jgi:hypothetical protein
MATRRTAGGGSAAKKKTAKRKAAPKTTSRPTLAGISKQLAILSAQIEPLVHLVRAIARITGASSESSATENGGSHAAAADDPSRVPPDSVAFDADLLRLIAELDRRGRHAGMVPIPDVREAFLRRGWTRRSFDQRLLQAERDFVVDLKTANDPARLSNPHLAIEEPGRGHLQFVVPR